MTEILLIVALVGVATIGVVGVLGNNDSAIANASAQALAGKNAQANTVKADNLHRTLATFGENEAAAANMDGNNSGMSTGFPSGGPGGRPPGGGVKVGSLGGISPP